MQIKLGFELPSVKPNTH